MPQYNHLRKLAVAAIVAALFLCPAGGYAADVQIFPPQPPNTPPGTTCPPDTADYTYALIWDGVSNVQCSQIPTTCTPGQGLQFDYTSGDSNQGNFICVTPCSGPVTTQTNVQSCPNSQTGSTYTAVTTQCDGTSTSSNVNSCGMLIPAVSYIQCNIGETVTGYYDANGQFDTQCTGSATPCSSYTCTASGLK